MLTFYATLLACWASWELEDRHAIYISVIEFKETDFRLKVFTDDLQDAIRNFNSGFQSVTDDSFVSRNHLIVQEYFRKTIEISINDEPVNFLYHSSTIEGDSYWINFRFNNPGGWKSFEMTDKHFMELFPTQTNILKMMGKKQRFCKFTHQSSSCRFDF